jgi:hypothetical protein
MNGFMKTLLFIQGMAMCLAWLAKEMINEYCPDLNLFKIPTHPNDYMWFAERWNGRVAMLAVMFIMYWELFHKQSIWSLIGVL